MDSARCHFRFIKHILITVLATVNLAAQHQVPQLTIITTSLPNATQNAPYSATLVAVTGQPPYTWSIVPPGNGLPTGLSLNASTGIISGTPTAVGTNSFTAKVTDAAAHSALKTLSITVQPPVSITTASLPAGTQNVSYSVALAAAGGVIPYTWSIASGSLPVGLSLASNGAISGTPTTPGPSNFIVRVTDVNLSTATKALSITIYAALIITTSSLPDGTLNLFYSAALAATGGDGSYTWSLVSGTLPAGLSLATDGTISGTPTALGTSNFTVQVTDGHSNAASEPLSVTVDAGSSSPVLDSLEGPSGNVGAPVKLRGSNFGATQGTSSVTFNGVAALTTVWGDNFIVAVVPSGATTGDVVVTVNNAMSNTLSFTVGEPTSDTVVSSVYQQTGFSQAWNNQKAIAIGTDGFSRFIVGDSSPNGASDEVVYVRCLDQDCTTSNTKTFVTGDFTLDFSVALGPDGFARIAYSMPAPAGWENDNVLGLIRCLDADCASSTNTIVVGESDNGVASVVVGADGTAYIVYDWGLDRSGFGQGVGLATCTSSGSCSTSHIAEIPIQDSIAGAIALDSMGNPIIAYVDDDTVVHYVGIGGDLVVSTDAGGYGLLDLVVGPDGYARVGFKGSGDNVDIIQCTSLACDSSQIAAIPLMGGLNVSLGVQDDGTVLLEASSGQPSQILDFLTCATTDCSDYDYVPIPGTWDFFGQYASLAVGSDNLPRMIALDSGGAAKHVRKTVAAKIILRSSGTVSGDDISLPTYYSQVGTTDLGAIIAGGTSPGCRMGTEAVGRITPSSYTGMVILHRWIFRRAIYLDSTPVDVIRYCDDTSPSGNRDDDPQSGGSHGKVYDTDSAGLGGFSDNSVHRYRGNFYEWAALPDGTRISPYYDYYIRLSCENPGNSGYQFVGDVLGDNQLGIGTTFISWNLAPDQLEYTYGPCPAR